MVRQSYKFFVCAIVWSCFSGMEGSFLKIVRDSFTI